MQFVQGGKSGHANVNNPGHAKTVNKGSLAQVETTDAVAMAGEAGSPGSLAATEAADTAAFTGETVTAGSEGILAATEAADTAALAGSIAVAGLLSVAETADTAALAGLIAAAGSLTASEAADAFAAAGAIVDPGSASGSLAAIEAADTAAATGEVTGEVVAPPIFVGGGRYHAPLRPYPVEGVGYGILPPIEGEAFGVVIGAGAGLGTLPRAVVTAAGSIGAAGISRAQFVVKAAACGQRGQAGRAVARLGSIKASSLGRTVACGKGFGMIMKLEGAAVGKYDDDEAAAVTFLLAA